MSRLVVAQDQIQQVQMIESFVKTTLNHGQVNAMGLKIV